MKLVIKHRKGEYRMTFEKVILNPGHGFLDPGAVTRLDVKELHEADLNLSIATRTFDLIKNYVPTVMTRKFGDKADKMELDQIVDIANSIKNAIFISVHTNSASNYLASGLEVWRKANGSEPITEQSIEIGDTIYRNIKLYSSFESYIYKCRGVVPATGEHAWCVLRKNIHPGVLIETGFLSNPTEARWLSSPIGINAIAYGIAKSIITMKGGK